MSSLKIIEAPDPRLRVISSPVDGVDDKLRTLMDQMLETMYAAPGIGLAAIQVNVPKRVIVLDIAGSEEDPDPRYFVNPEIVWQSDEMENYKEGCLSLPEYYAEVERPGACHIKHLDYDGKEHLLKAEGMLATCIQHEIDHLDGVLFTDKAVEEELEESQDKLTKLMAQNKRKLSKKRRA